MTPAGSTVKGGFYFNRDAWDLVTVSGKEGVLPGASGQRCLRVPVWAVLALAPMLGGLFVVFLPFIGFALVFMHLGRRSLAAARRVFQGFRLLLGRSRRTSEAPSAGNDSDASATAATSDKDGKPNHDSTVTK